MICGHNEKGLTSCTVHTKSSPSLLTNGTTDPWTMSLYFSSRSSSWLLPFLKTDKNGSKRAKVSQILRFFLTTSLHELLAARLTSYNLPDDCIWTDSVWCGGISVLEKWTRCWFDETIQNWPEPESCFVLWLPCYGSRVKSSLSEAWQPIRLPLPIKWRSQFYFRK